MNKNFVNKLLTIAILSICNNYINASDNSVPVVNFVIDKVSDFNVINNISNNSTSGSDKNSRNESPEMAKQNKLNEVEQINLYEGKDNYENNKGTVKYDPDKMWFDYQALFDNTRNAILEKDDIIKVECNIYKNELAKKVLCIDKNKYLISQMMKGKTWAQNRIMNCIENYNCSEDELVGKNKNCDEINYNYLYLLGIVASLAQTGNEIAKKRYLALVEYIPVDFYFDDISDMNFFNIMHPILHDN